MIFPLRPASLSVKVIFITSLILVLVILFIVWFNTRLYESGMMKLTSEFIEKNVIRAME